VIGLRITTATGDPGGVTPGFGGTSSATPLTAGVAALTISANPDLTAQEVVSILKQTASKDLSMDPYPRTPAAAFDPNPLWDVSPIAPFDAGAFNNVGATDGTWSPWFGHGRVDAAAAVQEALRRRGAAVEEVVREDSSPALAIPDNNAAGVRDSINIQTALTISAIKVSVDITHTFIGDLRLTLTAPSGTAVVFHDRNGGNTRDLRRSFDFSSTPAFGALRGQSSQGNWTVLVQDLATADSGVVNRWELEISGRRNAVVELSEAPGAAIPDNDPAGLERTLNANDAGMVDSVEVAVDITHTFIRDLQVTLVSPQGSSVPLHQRTGGDADNIIKTYTSANTPQLQTVRDQPIQGAWRLRIADLEAADLGKLNHWSLKIQRRP
jgi:subtilisin-like proprotein convertase family protein